MIDTTKVKNEIKYTFELLTQKEVIYVLLALAIFLLIVALCA